MSTSKLDRSGIFTTLLQPHDTRLTLPSNAVKFGKNGLEFRSAKAIQPWKEMTVDLYSEANGRRVHCTGVVVSCDGNRHAGYIVSIVFINLSRSAQAQLEDLARA